MKKREAPMSVNNLRIFQQIHIKKVRLYYRTSIYWRINWIAADPKSAFDWYWIDISMNVDRIRMKRSDFFFLYLLNNLMGKIYLQKEVKTIYSFGNRREM